MSNNIYTSREDAVKELHQRLLNKELRQKIEELLKGDIPEIFNRDDRPKSILFRHIVTPDLETSRFLELSQYYNLTPCCFEYHDDIFLAENEDKHALGKLYFYLNSSQDGQHNNFTIRIIDFNLAQKKPFNQIRTVNDEKLVDFHHRILQHYYPRMGECIFDASDWFHNHGPKAVQYYIDFFLLSIMHGILFENFRHDGGNEDWFMNNIAIPAFNKVIELTGYRPLICPIIDVSDENHPKWMGYDKLRKDFIVRAINSV